MEEGTLLLERYRVLEPLGEGGSSKVVKALDEKMDRVVAIKIISGCRQTAVKAVREAKTAALFNHPNIVTLFEFEQQDDSYYLIMEYVEGCSLAEIMAEFGPLSTELALAVAIQVCEALSCAHRNGIVHRDIKPANLKVLNDGRVKVMDFGIACFRGTISINDEIAGTIAYMSPEQATGGITDERSDIFSLGTLIYQMLTGKLPFQADAAAGTILQIQNKEPVPPSELVKDIEPDLSRVIAMAMAKSPDVRLANIEELKNRLQKHSSPSGPPAETVKEAMDKLLESRISRIAGLLAKARQRAAFFLREHQSTLIATEFAAAAAVCSIWEGASALLAVAIFFLALFLPSAGLAALLALLSAGLLQVSVYLGVAASVLFATYWLILGRRFPQTAIVPLLAPMVVRLKAPFLFPVAVGLIFSPAIAAFVAAFGAVSVALAEIVGYLNNTWFVGVHSQLILGASFNGQLKDLIGTYNHLRAEPWVLGQIGIWAVAAAATGLVRGSGRNRWIQAIAGVAALLMGYKLIPPYLGVDYDFNRLFLQPMAFSLIILAALLFIFQGPPRIRAVARNRHRLGEE